LRAFNYKGRYYATFDENKKERMFSLENDVQNEERNRYNRADVTAEILARCRRRVLSETKNIRNIIMEFAKFNWISSGLCYWELELITEQDNTRSWRRRP